MANLTACDNCEKTTRDPYGWWRLDSEGVIVRFGEAEPPYTFCSLRCVAAFAERETPACESMQEHRARYRGGFRERVPGERGEWG
jgi:hypothetical protein